VDDRALASLIFPHLPFVPRAPIAPALEICHRSKGLSRAWLPKAEHMLTCYITFSQNGVLHPFFVNLKHHFFSLKAEVLKLRFMFFSFSHALDGFRSSPFCRFLLEKLSRFTFVEKEQR